MKENQSSHRTGRLEGRRVNANTLILVKLHLEHHTQSHLSLFKKDELVPEDLGG